MKMLKTMSRFKKCAIAYKQLASTTSTLVTTKPVVNTNVNTAIITNTLSTEDKPEPIVFGLVRFKPVEILSRNFVKSGSSPKK